MKRTPIIAGNWKMNLLSADIARYASALDAAGSPEAEVEVALFPSSVHLAQAAAAMPAWVRVGAQDVHAEAEGAFTGDIAAGQARDAGCVWALAGHSERREHHGESNEEVARKAARALAAGLVPLVCLGETLEEREREQTEDVLAEQLDSLLELLSEAAGVLETADAANPGSGAMIAYEPVWAIGTGLSASPRVAASVHRFLRGRLEQHRNGLGEATRILYGGSVNAGNCRDLIGRPDIDGFLIGGASLDPASFLRIIRLSTGAEGGTAA